MHDASLLIYMCTSLLVLLRQPMIFPKPVYTATSLSYGIPLLGVGVNYNIPLVDTLGHHPLVVQGRTVLCAKY